MNQHASQRKNVSAGTTASQWDRRQFLATGVGALGAALIEPRLVRGSDANARIKLGLIGCGQRGTWLTNLFVQHGGYEVVAVADYFQDRAKAAGEKFGVAAGRRYSGLTGYQGLVASDVDAVAIESPPYFHPEQALSAVEAGRHVYQAKPLAVDVPGCLVFRKAARLATQNGLCFLVDFQTRTDAFYQEAVRRVHVGAIGAVVNGESVYYAGNPWKRHVEALRADPGNAELQVRAWGLSRTLSGDIITEQNIHTLDVATWIVDAAPIKAYGTCSRKARVNEPGDCHDNFAVIFTFPNNVVINFTSEQFSPGYQDIGCRVFGPLGSIDTHYFGTVSIAGTKPYAGGAVKSLYKNGAVANIDAFHKSVLKGDCSNQTVERSIRSNLTTILGRMAAYRHAEVTWDAMLAAGERWTFDALDRLKS